MMCHGNLQSADMDLERHLAVTGQSQLTCSDSRSSSQLTGQRLHLQGQSAFLIAAAGQDWGLCIAEWVDPPDPPTVYVLASFANV